MRPGGGGASSCRQEVSDSEAGESQAWTMRSCLILFQILDCSLHFNPAIKTQRGNTALVHTIWNGNVKACQVQPAGGDRPVLPVSIALTLAADTETERMRSERQDRVNRRCLLYRP
eukprot:340120-Hanusia_phi.AAC.4